MTEHAMEVADVCEEDMNGAFMEEIGPYLEELRTYCTYVASSAWDGEDLYQEVLLRAFIYRARVHRTSASFTKPYLFRMAQNVWVDMYRKHRGRMIPCEQVEHWGTDSNRYVEVRELVEHVADRVSERHVDMLLMLDVFRYSMEEIALISNTSVPAVKSALHRTRTKLRKARRGRGPQSVTVSNRAQVERWIYAVMKGDPSEMLANVSQG
ncbi:hypothetical protein BVG16_06090 [Paenibacillus selenitireducens]|uniref:Uncharacterized protein n=1 Tax=Paenibacillus selenitireducens TaxID=1324314 RepID=A0A1T2XKU8_9BACL|nr:RNA polymerase sigma factor [Paenibacillus selenitireducens]OPA80303.1 hypothetical protein BVG16_06090 [Paenibacillus selenitireducens]